MQKLLSEVQGRQRKEAYPEDADEGLPLPYSHESGAEAERLCQECEARAAAFCLRQAYVATGALLGDCEVAAQNREAACMTAGGEAPQRSLADLVPHPAGQGPERPRARSHLRRGGWRGCSSVYIARSARGLRLSCVRAFFGVLRA